MKTVWILVVFWSGSHGEKAVGQLGPFVSAKECQATAAIIRQRTETTSDKRICKEITKP